MKRVMNGHLLDDFMRREGRKQSWVAAQLGICESLVLKIKKGHVPKYDTLIRISDLLNVKVADLFKKEKNVA